jgi:hypothetical protein
MVAFAILLRLWPSMSTVGYVLLALAAPIVLIWFPEQVDDYTFGMWDKGNRIDVHTPPLMIAIFGWALLLLEASVVFYPPWLAHFLYGR